ncbi:hypothetical protein [Mycobacterium phage WXIN]|nr:hypothetical protein [Mycobacterium phage WXIN]
MAATTKLKITLYSVDMGVRSAVRAAFEGAGYDVLEITDASKQPRVDINEEQQPGTMGRLALPDRVDAVVTKTGLNSKIEGLAATLALKQGRNDVYAYVLPEALNALRGKLDRLGELVIVGGDQAK